MAHFFDFVLPGPRPPVSFDGPVAVEMRAGTNLKDYPLLIVASAFCRAIETLGVCAVDKIVRFSIERSPEPGDVWIRIIATKEVA